MHAIAIDGEKDHEFEGEWGGVWGVFEAVILNLPNAVVWWRMVFFLCVTIIG